LTTRDQEVEIVLLTNLPPADAVAGVVSELFRTRWKIERESDAESPGPDDFRYSLSPHHSG